MKGYMLRGILIYRKLEMVQCSIVSLKYEHCSILFIRHWLAWQKIQTQVEKVQLKLFPFAEVPISEGSPFIWPSTECVNTEPVSEILESHVGGPRIIEKKLLNRKSKNLDKTWLMIVYDIYKVRYLIVFFLEPSGLRWCNNNKNVTNLHI